jgi:hypothetical protein
MMSEQGVRAVEKADVVKAHRADGTLLRLVDFP